MGSILNKTTSVIVWYFAFMGKRLSLFIINVSNIILIISMSHLSISARFFRSHLLELKSSYYTKKGLPENTISFFGLLSEIWGTPRIMPVSLENRYYPDRNIWVVCIIPLNRRFEYYVKTIDIGLNLEQTLTFLGNNLEKPVYLYGNNTFYPIYKTDIVEWNGLFGMFEDIPNHLKEPTDDTPLEGIDTLIKQAKYCVSVFEDETTNGMGDPYDMDRQPEKYYFSNLSSAKLFYNKKVARFMEHSLPEYRTNFNDFSQSSLSWHGWKSYMVNEFGDTVNKAQNLFISIKTVKISYEKIEGEYDLI